MTSIRHLRTEQDARALAAELLGDRRTRPTVLVASGVGHDPGWIDAEAVAAEVGSYADVVRIPTGEVTWAFSTAMPTEAQVFGDAARVYHLDRRWISYARRSRLYIAYHPDDGTIVDQLVDDATADAMTNGLLDRPAVTRGAFAVTGVVALVGNRRALVKARDVPLGMTSIREELTVEGAAINRVVSAGMTVHGTFHPEEGFLDVRASFRDATEALGNYEAGDVVLARVVELAAVQAQLELYPGVRTTIRVAQVTGNPRDRLDHLMSRGEVVRARVLRAGPKWLLGMLDIDDDDDVVPAPSLLPSGPAWLAEAAVEPILVPSAPVDDVVAPDLPMTVPVDLASDDDPPTTADGPEAPVQAPPVAARPDPRLLDPRRRDAVGSTPATAPVAPPAPVPTPVPPLARPEVPAGMGAQGSDRAAVKTMAEAVRRLQGTVDALTQENRQLARRSAELQDQLDAQKDEAKRLRTEMRKAGQVAKRRARSGELSDGSAFLDPAEQFRHEVYMTWVEKIPASEKVDRPLPVNYSMSDHFFETLAEMPPAVVKKVPEVVVEVLTGIALASVGRETHALRSSAGGDAPPVTRANGTEVCMRTAVQKDSPGAARLHWWRGGTSIELASVRHHDDVKP